MDFKQTLENAKQKTVNTYHKVKRKTLEVGCKVCDWAKKNPEAALGTVVTAVGIARKGVKNYKNYQLEHEHDKEVYDESLHMYHPVKRKLTYNEELYYKNSVRAGANAIDVLKELRIYRG